MDSEWCYERGQPPRSVLLKELFEAYVKEHPFLKNLEWVAGPTDWPGSVLIGHCDRINGKSVRAFFAKGPLPEGLRVFVMDAAYGGSWEEVR